MHTSESLVFSLLLATVLIKFPEEADLVARLRARDPDAMSELYDRYGRTAYSVILRVVRDRGAAEDLVQECFLRVWNRVAAFDSDRGAIGPWLLTVARNQALDYVRSVEGRAWSAMKTADTERPQWFSGSAAETELINSVEVKRIQAALGQLSDRQKQLIEMAYFEGLTQTEMSERLQQPLGTIKTWMRAALQLLRDGAQPVSQ